MDLHEFATKVGSAIVEMSGVAVMNHPGTVLTDSQFLGVITVDGKHYSIHIQETE